MHCWELLYGGGGAAVHPGLVLCHTRAVRAHWIVSKWVLLPHWYSHPTALWGSLCLLPSWISCHLPRPSRLLFHPCHPAFCVPHKRHKHQHHQCHPFAPFFFKYHCQCYCKMRVGDVLQRRCSEAVPGGDLGGRGGAVLARLQWALRSRPFLPPGVHNPRSIPLR